MLSTAALLASGPVASRPSSGARRAVLDPLQPFNLVSTVATCFFASLQIGFHGALEVILILSRAQAVRIVAALHDERQSHIIRSSRAG